MYNRFNKIYPSLCGQIINVYVKKKSLILKSIPKAFSALTTLGWISSICEYRKLVIATHHLLLVGYCSVLYFYIFIFYIFHVIILHIRKLKLRKAKRLSQIHIADEQQCRNSHPIRFGSKG